MDPTNRWTLSFAKLILVKWTRVIVSMLLSVHYISLPMQAKSSAYKLVNISLTPKGPLVPTRDKPILGCVVWSHTIFRIFETSCEAMSQNKLRVSANFMIFVATVQKLWMFEVFKWTQGKAGMCRNQPARVDYLRKKWRATQKKIHKKRGRPTLSKYWPAASRQPAVARRPWVDT
jgi:hypothetical protein